MIDRLKEHTGETDTLECMTRRRDNERIVQSQRDGRASPGPDCNGQRLERCGVVHGVALP